MSGSIRVSAKTVDDAITEALIQLGVTSDRLDYQVIEKGSAGFLGIGVKQAVIEARKKTETEKEEKPEVNSKMRSEMKSDMKSELKAEANSDIHSEVHTGNHAKVHTEIKPEVQSEVKKEFKKTQANDTKKKDYYKKEVKEYAHPGTDKISSRHESELAEVKDETKNAVESFLRDTLKAMDMTVELVSEIDGDGALSIEMKGDNMGILIGKRGQTLDSLQYLANRVANKNQEGYVRVKLDTENYRARREETLKNLAKNIAYKVKRSRRAVSLEPMNPYERRIIHAALQSDPYVTTHSEGEEPYRKVVVTLK